MKRIVFTTLLSITLVLPAAVLAQAGKPAAAKADAAKRSASRAHVDARDCLRFSTNMEIHRCALKYR